MITPGVRDMILAISFFALMNLFVKFLSHIPAVEVVFFRSIISLGLSGGILWYRNIPLLGNQRKILFWRGLAGTVALILYFITLQRIPLAGAVTIHYMAPLFTSILGIFLVKEKVKPWQWLFFLISFGGVVIIQGIDHRITWYYALVGIVGAFFSGLAYNMIRRLKTSEHPLVIILYFPLISVPVTGFICLYYWVTPSGRDWLYLILVGILTQFGQYFMTRSYQSEELSKVSIISYLGIMFALGFGFVFFDEFYGIPVYAGMLVVLLGVVLNLRYKSIYG